MNPTGRSSTEPSAVGEPVDASDAIAELFRVQFTPMVRLAELRPDERACIVLRYYDDRSLADIAAELGMPVGTVKSHLHRGLARLRHLLGEEDR